MEKRTPSGPAGTAGEERTRRALIATSLEMFAMRGVEATSLRSITMAACAANRSAVHYHFENKLGLIRAVLNYVSEQLAPQQQEALRELERLAAQRPLVVPEIVSIGFSPYVSLFLASREGRIGIRFLSRLTWEASEDAQSLLVQSVRPYFQNLLPMIQRVVPAKPLDALEFQMYLAVGNLIHGLAGITLLGRDPAGLVQDLYRRRAEDLLRYFFAYISSGLEGEAPA